ncbi:MAG TPA: PilZ domain-containing protein [Acidiferrobacterales bacterium]
MEGNLSRNSDTGRHAAWGGGPHPARRDHSSEHKRENLRKKIDFGDLVRLGLTHSVPWHIVDLGLGGALVRMDTPDVHVGARFEFVLRFKKRGRVHEHRLPARVLRVDARGVALQFDRYDDAAYTDLTDLLYSL